MACDICGKTGTTLTDLREPYQTADVKAICYDCEKVVNRQHGKLMSMVLNMLADLLKRFIKEKRAKHQGAAMQAEQKRRFDAWKKLENPKCQPTDDSMQDRRDWTVWSAALSHPSTPQGWKDIPEGCTPHDAKVLREANHAMAEENQQLRKALRFYASREHFNLADSDAWDTVSGEPQNWWCDEAGTATVEDGAIAAMALRGESIDWGGDEGLPEPPICPGEPESQIAAPPEQGSKG